MTARDGVEEECVLGLHVDLRRLRRDHWLRAFDVVRQSLVCFPEKEGGMVFNAVTVHVATQNNNTAVCRSLTRLSYDCIVPRRQCNVKSTSVPKRSRKLLF